MSTNYTLGKGKLFFGQYVTGTQTPKGERFFGDVRALNMTAEQENLDHFSSTSGIRTKDASVVLQLDYSGSFETEEISAENLSLFFLGDALTTTATSAPVTGEALADVEKGLRYQLGVSSTLPSGVRKVSAVTVKKGATTLVAGTDYVLDAALGSITILTTSSTVVDGDDLTVDYTIDASTRERVVSKSKTIEGSLRYVADNPSGTNRDFFMPYVKITPNGDFALIGEEWQVLGFSLEILKKSGLEAVYIDGRAA